MRRIGGERPGSARFLVAVLNRSIDARVLVAGETRGEALVLDQTRSFWGGFDSAEGKIIDVHHTQFGARVGARVLCIPRSKGSAGTPGGIAETLRNGSGPRAFVLGEPDVNISVGVLVANRLYGMKVPVVCISMAEMARIVSGDEVSIDLDGRLSVVSQR